MKFTFCDHFASCTHRFAMEYIIVTVIFIIKLFTVENRMLVPLHYGEESSVTNGPSSISTTQKEPIESHSSGEILPVQGDDEMESEEYLDYEVKALDDTKKKACAIVVLSNNENPNKQSLIRKYRYDANGVLIPSSVKYFVRLPQGISTSSHLVPLSDKAFSAVGGYVRYYKEVPPIPHSW